MRLSRLNRLALIVAAALLSAACASKSYCMGKQKYDHVASITPLKGGDGLQIPESPNALRVPAAPPESQNAPYGQRVADAKRPGRTHIQCLDDPPPMPPQAEAAPTAQ